MNKMVLLVVLLVALSSPCIGQTNGIFRTQLNQGEPVNDSQHAEFQTNMESLPEDLYPEGHWGATQGGIRLSVRLDKDNYAVGEPIVATVLIRNVTNRVVQYGFTYPLPYTITNVLSGGTVNRANQFDFDDGAMHGAHLSEGMQDRWQVTISQKYSLQKGTYVIQFTQQVERENTLFFDEIRSALVSFSVVDPPPSGQRSNSRDSK